LSWLTPKLKHRIQIQKPTQTPNDTTGGFDRGYSTLTTVWAGMEEMTDYNKYTSYIRGGNTDEKVSTHKFFVRYSAVKNLGKSFTSAFSGGYDSIEDINPLKSDMFIFLQTGTNVKGRLFQIVDILRDNDRKEWLKFQVKEIEEVGTGYAI